uniref:Uncharacterized protein n=1 Tax=Steinernema glaseri TaxID=37863 RepID=A0A1I7YBB1_9BILA
MVPAISFNRRRREDLKHELPEEAPMARPVKYGNEATFKAMVSPPEERVRNSPTKFEGKKMNLLPSPELEDIATLSKAAGGSGNVKALMIRA